MADTGSAGIRTTALPASGVRALNRMRLGASLLLAGMAGLYIAAVLNHDGHPVWGYLRAFAEAAMVGGLADWFAVTALFRHPLGIPIPHTAIIPESKDRIGDALGQFVAANFLAADVVGARLKDKNLSGAIARQLAEPNAARQVALGLLDAVRASADLLEDETVGEFLRRQIEAASRSGSVSTAIARALDLIVRHGRREHFLDAALAQAWRMLEQNEKLLRQQVRSRTSWFWRIIGLDARASDAIIEAVQKTLEDVTRDHDHPLRKRAFEVLDRLAYDLEHSPRMRQEVERFIAEALNQPAVQTYLGGLWQSLKHTLQRQAADPEGQTLNALIEAINGFGQALLNDAEVQAALNQRLRALLAEISGRHGSDVGKLISDTIRAWDAQTIVARLEENVGADLQIIRINGTLIGGLVGLVIHQTTLWLT